MVSPGAERSWPTPVLATWLPLAGVLAVLIVALPLSPPWDLAVFLHAGHALLHGRPIYPRPGTPAVYSGFSFVYPYFAAWLFVPAAAMPSSVAVPLFIAISAGAVLAAGVLAVEATVWAVALVLASSFVVTGLQLGALSPLLLAGALWMWRLRDRPLGFAILAAFVGGSKLFLVPLLLWPLAARRWRVFAMSLAVLALVLGVGFVLGQIGPGAYATMLSQLGAHEARAGFGVIGALRNLGLTPAAAYGAAAALATITGAAGYAAYRRNADERLLYCAGLVASLLLSPVVWSHYLALTAAALLVLGVRTRWFLALCLLSWALAPPHGVHLQDGLTGAGKLSALWVSVVLVVVCRFAMRPATSARTTARVDHG